MNATITKFGYPATLIRAYDHWVVLARPAQLTLGSLVLASTSDATAFGDLPPAAFAELHSVTHALEAALKAAVDHDRLNYLMLMMVDPHVHFHVFPRYDGTRTGGGLTLADPSWPGPPDLGKATKGDADALAALVGWLRPYWA